MYKNTGANATPGGEFTDGDPGTNTPGSTLGALFMNMMLREGLALVNGAGLTPSLVDETQMLQAVIALAGGGGIGSKNRLINGDFRLRQRATTTGQFAIANTALYTLDRWKACADSQGSGSGTATITRQAFSPGQVLVPGNPRYFARWVQTVASTISAPTFVQLVENVQDYGLGKWTLHGWIKASGTMAGFLKLFQNFGTGGSPSGQVAVGSATVNMTTAWQHFSLSVDLTALGFTMVGKTLGTNGDDHFRCEVTLPHGTTYTIDIADMQLEPSSTATSFDRRTDHAEYLLAARYYEKNKQLEGTGSAVGEAGQTDSEITGREAPNTKTCYGTQTRFRVPKRKTPTVVWYNGQTGTANGIEWEGENHTINGAITAGGPSPECTGAATVNGTPTPGQGDVFRAHFTADAEI